MFILQFFAVLIVGYVYLATIVVVWAIFFGRDLEKEPFLNKKFFNHNVLGLCAFVGVMLLLQGGFENALFFIPSDWGSTDEYGDWESTRKSISFALGFYTAIVLTLFVGKVEELRKKQN